MVAHALDDIPRPEPLEIPLQPAPGSTNEDLRRVIGKGAMHALLFGEDGDGMHFFIDFAVEAVSLN